MSYRIERFGIFGILFILAACIGYLFFLSSQSPWLQSVKIQYDTVTFAGEQVPFDGLYKEINREKLEREIINLRFSYEKIQIYHKRELLYIPYIREKLRSANIPEDFIYLVIAESALKNGAYSSAGAAGIWQFMPDTARHYGLRVDKEIDERYNFEKATDAAITYLKKIYDDLGNWTLTAAAYNRWENGIRRDLKEQWVSSYYDLDLNSETSRYIWRILAIKYIMEQRYNLYEQDILGEQFIAPMYLFQEVEWSGISIYDLAKQYGQTPAVMKETNAWILWDSIPEWKWIIKIIKP